MRGEGYKFILRFRNLVNSGGQRKGIYQVNNKKLIPATPKVPRRSDLLGTFGVATLIGLLVGLLAPYVLYHLLLASREWHCSKVILPLCVQLLRWEHFLE